MGCSVEGLSLPPGCLGSLLRVIQKVGAGGPPSKMASSRASWPGAEMAEAGLQGELTGACAYWLASPAPWPQRGGLPGFQVGCHLQIQDVGPPVPAER